MKITLIWRNIVGELLFGGDVRLIKSEVKKRGVDHLPDASSVTRQREPSPAES